MPEEMPPSEAEAKPGSPPEPDLRFAHNESNVEVYNLQTILSEQGGRIYDRSDFGGVIQRAIIDESLISLDGGYTGLALTLSIELDALRDKHSYTDPIDDALQLSSSSFIKTTKLGEYPNYINDCSYVVTNEGLRLVVWHDKSNNRVVLSNDLVLTRGENRTPVVSANPAPLESLEGEKQVEGFIRVAVNLLDSIATKKQKRTYRIGETIRDVPAAGAKGLGGAAVRGVPKQEKSPPPNPKADIDPDRPLAEFEDIFSAVNEGITLSDIGGLEDIKRELQDIALSFSKAEIMAKWGATRPQGILLYGEPGTGKTMLVEALANEIGAEMIKIQSSDIYIKWLGDSEVKIKELFDAFRKINKPTVVLFDEFDAIVGISENPSPGGADNARNSVAGIFKQEMNTLAKDNTKVLIVGTTNHQDRIDPSLIRSGRFDHRLYVPMPDDDARSQILSNQVSKLMMSHNSEEFQIFAGTPDVPQLVGLTDGMSGADIAEVFRR